jgi:hypothetical protein
MLTIGSLLGAFKLPIQQLFNINIWYETNSRGKLTWAEIDVLLVNNVPTLAVMYMVGYFPHTGHLGLLPLL